MVPSNEAEGMAEAANLKLPVLLECGDTILIEAVEMDWQGKFHCPICGVESVLDLRRRPVKKK